MSNLTSAIPELVIEINDALKSVGRADLTSQLETAIIERCSYDHDAGAGYIQFVRPKVSWYFSKLASPIAETISFLESGFSIDMDHDGQLFGIEFLSRNDFVEQLKKAKLL